MAQLSNDCFAFGDAPLTIDEALVIIRERIPAVTGTKPLSLMACDGRILAQDIPALSPLPAFFNSAVDGYAVCHADLSPVQDVRLPLKGRLQAGATDIPDLQAGSAMRIFTGAPMPFGADTVFMQEDVSENLSADDPHVVLSPGLKSGANCRPAGEEAQKGDIILKAGTRLLPHHLALAAGTGHHTLPVRKRVRVAVFSTGDELVDLGTIRSGAQVFDTNRVMLLALLKRIGCEVCDLGILKDEPHSLMMALRDASTRHDLIITSGGVSTGEADYVKTAVEALGRLDHWRFAIKPGRPLAMGVVGTAAFCGLPGNPVAVFVTFTQVVRAVIAALGGEHFTAPRFLPVISGFAHRKKPGRVEFLRVSLQQGPQSVVAIKFPIEGAGIIRSLTESDGIARLAFNDTDIKPGDTIEFQPFSAML